MLIRLASLGLLALVLTNDPLEKDEINA